MSDTRDKLAAALYDADLAANNLGDEAEWAEQHVTVRAVYFGQADALLASDVLRDMLTEVRAEALRNPYDEDGYCEFCGNGSWKAHAPECAWADLQDAYERGRAEVTAAVEGLCDNADFGDYDGLAGAVRTTDLRAALADRGALNRARAETLREAAEELPYVGVAGAKWLRDRADRVAQDGGA